MPYKDQLLNVPVLCRLQREFAREYYASHIAGISETGVHVASGFDDDTKQAEAMQEVAPLSEWKFNQDITGPKDDRTYIRYETFIDGVRFFCLLRYQLPQDQPAPAGTEASA